MPIAPSLSEREVNRLADIVREARMATEFLGGRTADDLSGDAMRFHALRNALRNVAEACIQIDAGTRGQRFAALSPGHDIRPIRVIGNALRHDYNATTATLLVNDTLRIGPVLAARAEALLDAHRRLHGADPGRLS